MGIYRPKQRMSIKELPNRYKKVQRNQKCGLILLPTSGEVRLGDAGLLVPGPAGHTAAAHQPEHDDGNLGLLLSLLLLLSTA